MATLAGNEKRFMIHLQFSLSLQEEKGIIHGQFDAAQKLFVSDVQYIDRDL